MKEKKRANSIYTAHSVTKYPLLFNKEYFDYRILCNINSFIEKK